MSVKDNRKKNVDRMKDHYSDQEIKDQIDRYSLVKNDKPEKISVIYIDDEEDALKSFKALYRFDFNIFITSSVTEAEEIIDNNDIHVIIIDQRMPEITGVEFLSKIIKKHPEPIRILLTGYSDINSVIAAINQGKIFRYMSKPYLMEDMKQIIEIAAETYFLRKDKEQLLKAFARCNSQLEFMFRQKMLDI